MPDNPTPEMLKRMRMDAESSSSMDVEERARPSAGPSKSRSATVEDADDEEMNGVDRNFAPGGDADYFAEEDEEGRFFGGGLSREQKDILNIFDKDGGEGVREDVGLVHCPGFVHDLPLTARGDEHHRREANIATVRTSS